jgi:hypothetical protein
MVLSTLVGLVECDLLVFAYTKQDVLSKLLDVISMVLLVNNVRKTFLILLILVLFIDGTNSSIFRTLNVAVDLVIEEILQKLVFIEDLQELERASLVIIEHAVELGDLAVAHRAFPVRDLALV